nr:hypothetical protein [Tanacetum cinerariifolium]
KPIESEGFKQIIDFLNGSSISYALTTIPTIRTSCIKQFWTTAKVKTINDECLSAKTTSWNEFSSTMASAVICLATNQKFNFSRYILLSLVKNIEAGVPFFMFPRFVQLLIDHQMGDMSHYKDIYDNPSLTKKVFTNMKRVGTGFSEVVTLLFDNMLVPVAKEVDKGTDVMKYKVIQEEEEVTLNNNIGKHIGDFVDMPSEAVEQAMDANVPDEIDGDKGEQVPNHVVNKGSLEFLVCKEIANPSVNELVDKGRPLKKKRVYAE